MLFKPVGIDRKGKINGFQGRHSACQDEIVLVKTLYLSWTRPSVFRLFDLFDLVQDQKDGKDQCSVLLMYDLGTIQIGLLGSGKMEQLDGDSVNHLRTNTLFS